MPTSEPQNSKLSTGSRDESVYHLCTVSGCNRSYKYKGDLRVHMLSHNGK